MDDDDDQFADAEDPFGESRGNPYGGINTVRGYRAPSLLTTNRAGPPPAYCVPLLPPPPVMSFHHIPPRRKRKKKLKSPNNSQRQEEEEESLQQQHNVETETIETENEVVLTDEAQVVPDSVVREQVSLATSLVAAEIASGVWTSQQSSYSTRATAALEQFSTDVILPSLQSSFTSAEFSCIMPKRKRKDKEKIQRCFIAALLMLREVIMLNAETMLGSLGQQQPPPPQDGNDTDDFQSQRKALIEQKEERDFHAHLLGTGLISAAVERLGDKQLDRTLQDTMEKYDSGHVDFASALEPANGQIMPVYPNDAQEDEVAYRVSYNCALKSHSLLHQATKAELRECREVPALRHSIVLPKANACHVSVVEQEPEMG